MQGDDDSESEVDVDNPFGEFRIEEDIEDEDVGTVQRDERKAAAAVSGISMDVSAAPQELECNSTGMDCPMYSTGPAPAHADQRVSRANVEVTTQRDTEQLEQGDTAVCAASGAHAAGEYLVSLRNLSSL